MKKILSIALFLIFVICLGSCKKDNGSTCSLNNSSLSGEWIITAYKYQSSASAPILNFYTNWSTCEKNNLFVIESDGTISIERSPSCGTPDIGEYSLSGTVFNAIFNSGDYYYGNISKFSCTSFVLVETDPISGEIYSYTFQKQL